MVGSVSEMQGQLSHPSNSTLTNQGMEARRVTRRINGVFKRKRSETENSDTEIMDSDNVKCLKNNNKSVTLLGEIATLITTLKKIIE